MFKFVKHISDIQPMVADKKEIRFLSQPNGITIGCYLFMDSMTFDSTEALECRGIAFDQSGAIISRPVHKFFNVSEKECLSPEKLLTREDIVGIFDKVDGSMIATAWIDGNLHWRSKKSFNSDVVKLACDFLTQPNNIRIADFAKRVASNGMTAIFELTHPEARIIVAQEKPALQLLHVRDNHTGEYVLLDDTHVIHQWIHEFEVPKVQNYVDLDLSTALESLADMQDQEGYIIQFTNGDMVKVKCPWYLRLHRSITYLRERDIAMLALKEELDDVKSSLAEAGIDLTAVNEVESRLKTILSELLDQIETVYTAGKHLERKEFAITYKDHPLFGMIMQRYLGKEVPLLDWYSRNRLKDEFSLRSLASEAISEAMDG